MIALSYTKSFNFLADFLSVMGSSIITHRINSFSLLGTFKVFKIFRIKRLNKFVNSINVEEKLKGVLNVFKVSFYLFLYLHILACSWYNLTMKTAFVRYMDDEDGNPTDTI